MGIDVHQDFYVVAEQAGGTNPKPAQRFHKQAFLHGAAKLKQSGAEATSARQIMPYRNPQSVLIHQQWLLG